MKSSELVLGYLKETGEVNQQKINDLLSLVILELLNYDDEELSNPGGLVYCALKEALDSFDRGDAVAELLQEFREDNDEDEETD